MEAYAAMRIANDSRREATLDRIENAGHPIAAALIGQVGGLLAIVYENNIEKKGQAWQEDDVYLMLEQVDKDLGIFYDAVEQDGESANVFGIAAGIALRVFMVAWRAENVKRENRASVGIAYHSKGYGILDFNPNTKALCPECKAPVWVEHTTYCKNCGWNEVGVNVRYEPERTFERQDGKKGVRPGGIPPCG